jgi:hypothetical protein
MRILFETVFGSHLYGTNTLTSDHDFKGVYVPSPQEILRPRIPDVKTFNTGNTKTKNSADDVDRELYSVHKFFDMLIKGDMNAYELLFAPGYTANSDWMLIREHREKFLSRKCRGMVGYVQRQASVYGARGDRLNEVTDLVNLMHELAKGDYTKKLGEHVLDFIAHCGMGRKYTELETIFNQGKDLIHIMCCDRKVPMTITFKDAIEIYQRVIDNYGNRARAAATNEGLDWKAISHAVRIGEQAVELLVTGEIIFPRPNAARLLSIKKGELEYGPIAEELDFLLETIEQLSNTSRLPDVPDIEFMEQLREDFYLNEVKKIV